MRVQLTPNTCIRHTLAIATCTLLGTATHPARAETGSDNWRVDGSVLFYTEQDRISVIEPVVFLRKRTGDESYLNVRLVYDSMTGASPNGATATNTPQTFTSPSGTTTYTTPAGQTPLHKFNDTRVAISADWEKPINRMRRGVYGISVSKETDYSSAGLSANLIQDFNDKLTTLTVGIAASYDNVSPEGGTPVPLQLMSAIVPPPPGSDDDEGGEGNPKTSVDGIIGITQVLSRRALTQLNYSIGQSSGYLTDPYKIV
jgi:hypothetical protein